MRRALPEVLLRLAMCAALAAGCSGSAYVRAGDPPTILEITNDTEVVRYLYIDDIYIGCIDPGETASWYIGWGWHTIAAYDDPDALVDPILIDCYCEYGHTFFWSIELEIVIDAQGTLIPPAELSPDPWSEPAAPPAGVADEVPGVF